MYLEKDLLGKILKEIKNKIGIRYFKEKCLKKSKSAVPDGKALSVARTQLGHHVSLLIGLANEGVGFHFLSNMQSRLS